LEERAVVVLSFIAANIPAREALLVKNPDGRVQGLFGRFAAGT
jgi:hypothetical protein